MLPHIILHSMVSVDGRMDLPAPDLGLYYEVAPRWEVDAILSGSETILAGFSDPEADAQDVASNSAQEGPAMVRQWSSPTAGSEFGSGRSSVVSSHIGEMPSRWSQLRRRRSTWHLSKVREWNTFSPGAPRRFPGGVGGTQLSLRRRIDPRGQRRDAQRRPPA